MIEGLETTLIVLLLVACLCFLFFLSMVQMASRTFHVSLFLSVAIGLVGAFVITLTAQVESLDSSINTEYQLSDWNAIYKIIFLSQIGSLTFSIIWNMMSSLGWTPEPMNW